MKVTSRPWRGALHAAPPPAELTQHPAAGVWLWVTWAKLEAVSPFLIDPIDDADWSIVGY